MRPLVGGAKLLAIHSTAIVYRLKMVGILMIDRFVGPAGRHHLGRVGTVELN